MHIAKRSGRLLVAEVSGAAVGGLTLLAAAGAGKKYRLFSLLITSDTAVGVAGADGFGTHYVAAGGHIPLDYGPEGKSQNTHNTALTLTAAANVSAIAQYAIDEGRGV
jgi:hypothetical protein